MSSENLLFLGMFGALAIASTIGATLKRTALYQRDPRLVEESIVRTNAWWLMTFLFLGALKCGVIVTTILFCLISLLALREFLSLVPTRRGDHRALFWSFSAICPFHYYLIGIKWYGLYSIFIPVYAYLLTPARMAVQQDCTSFLERAAKIQWGLMLCVYSVSYAPALLSLQILGYEGQEHMLLFYLVVITEMSDIFQFIAGKAFGKRHIAPLVSPNKTWEGFYGGLLGSAILGAALTPFTPFTLLVSATIALIIAVVGFLGGLTMSAVKRDIGVKDYGSLIRGHGGMLDRIDSLCFSAPVFFHLVRYFFAQ